MPLYDAWGAPLYRPFAADDTVSPDHVDALDLWDPDASIDSEPLAECRLYADTWYGSHPDDCGGFALDQIVESIDANRDRVWL